MVVAVRVAAATAATIRPVPRGGEGGNAGPATDADPGAVRAAPQPREVVQPGLTAGLVRSLRPMARPENLRRRATVRQVGYAPIGKRPGTGTKGALCGDPDIRGSTMAPIAGRIRGCGVEAPVKVTSVAGVALSQGAVMDCATARALKEWTQRGVKPAFGKLGGGVRGLRVAAHYACRTRNNRKGAKISEHGKGRAIDISAIQLQNGVEVTILRGWRDRQFGPKLRQLHTAACGPFGTVLGPNADRYHQDHFHFDTARYRSGAYCR
ncbi:extensin family protein [Rhodobacteraceae bacterium CCMM004]|nr:extensin family protein [Rhodobacteraceae bacterium CCMM004]